MAGIEKYLRTPIKMQFLIELSAHELDKYVLYTNSDVEVLNADTDIYLDDFIEVDDDGNEVYPPFARDKDLLYYLNGDLAADIIKNTIYQLDPEVPGVKDYIKNFNNYCDHDCFFDFG